MHPALIISSAITMRSMAGRPPPPNSTGQVMPIQPSAARTRENSLENPLIHESVWLPYSATPPAATSRARARSDSSSGPRAKSNIGVSLSGRRPPAGATGPGRTGQAEAACSISRSW